MTPDAILSEILRRSDFIFAGWNVLILAGIGVLAAVGLSHTLRTHRRAIRLLIAAFGFFALTHLLGMIHVAKQWASLTEGFHHALASDPTLNEKLEFAVLAPTIEWIMPFHLVFDALVMWGVWWMARGEVTSPEA
jgi:hypothetical protein